MGSEEAGSERTIQLGGSYIVDGQCFPEKAHYIALGHIHKPQVIPGTKGWGRYAGSPIHFNRREIAYGKKCIVAEIVVSNGVTVKNEISEIDLKAYKPIEVWKCDNVDDATFDAQPMRIDPVGFIWKLRRITISGKTRLKNEGS